MISNDPHQESHAINVTGPLTHIWLIVTVGTDCLHRTFQWNPIGFLFAHQVVYSSSYNYTYSKCCVLGYINFLGGD